MALRLSLLFVAVTFLIVGAGSVINVNNYVKTDSSTAAATTEPDRSAFTVSNPAMPYIDKNPDTSIKKVFTENNTDKETTKVADPEHAAIAEIPIPDEPTIDDSPEVRNCTGSNFDKIRCYRTVYRDLVVTDDVETAMINIQEKYKSGDNFMVSQCHQVTHIVGRAAVEKYPTVAEAYSHGDAFCWSGYYHGVMEGILARVDRAEIPKTIDTICDDIPDKDSYSFDYYNCVHGLGHGVMFVENNEVFDSLMVCDGLTGHWERSACYGGVYMENIIADEVNHFSKFLNDDDPIYPCNAVDDQYKQSCYLMQTSHMLKVVGYDFSQVFQLCSEADANYINTCYQSLGRDASGQSISDIERTKNTCMLGATFRQQSNCIIGAVKDFVAYHHSDVKAHELCAVLPNDLADVCYPTVDNYYKYF